MFGIRFIKTQPTTYVMQYKKGKIVREGAGLDFFFFAPTTSLVAVPIASTDAPFIFEEATADFQEISIQGQVTYRISDPRKIASMLNFLLNANTQEFESDDPEQLPQRVINVVKVLTQKVLRSLSLREALSAADKLVTHVRDGLGQSNEIQSLGLEILGVSILAIKPNPETARALEAETREQLLREADDARYNRRNSAIQQERSIRENELNTEIAVENKKRQIREAQMDAEMAVQEKKHQLEESEMASRITLEEQNKTLVELSVANQKSEADARAYAVAASMKAIEGVDAKVVQALASTGMQPDQLLAMAFQGLADKADKIGQLNVSPELLREILAGQGNGKKK
ncbi:MAG: SPFH domain-containing protein [Blastocatellia bacterium]|nr:SPFH domain-containing protein [Blastocatellia bacterium]